MIRSMTGYGQGTSKSADLRVTVDLRTVNHRFIDLRLKLPACVQHREPQIRKALQARVRRGRLEISISIERGGNAGPTFTLNRPLLDAVTGAAGLLHNEVGVEGRIDVSTVLRIPGVFLEDREDAPLSEADVSVVERAIAAALQAHDEDRAREGGELGKEILGRIETMTGLVAEIREYADAVPEATRKKLVERIEALTRGLEIDPNRLAQEAAFLADRSDVTEELVRLESHLAHVHGLLDDPDGEPVGKRLDFLVQEIHRETNTINSKSSDLEVGRRAMALKVETEKIREQVQNLE